MLEIPVASCNVWETPGPYSLQVGLTRQRHCCSVVAKEETTDLMEKIPCAFYLTNTTALLAFSIKNVFRAGLESKLWILCIRMSCAT